MTTATAQPFTPQGAHDRSAPGPARPERFTQAYSFDRMTISQKLMVCFVSILTLTVIIGGVGYFGIAKISRDWEAGGQRTVAAMAASQLTAEVARAELHAERFQAGGRTSDLVAARENLTRARAALASATAMPGLDTGNLAALESALGRYETGLAQLETDRGGPAAAAIARSGDELARQSAAVRDNLNQGLAKMRSDLGAFMYWSRFAILGLVLVWAANAVAVSRRVGREISGRIKQITKAMLRLVEGDKNLVVPDTDRADEFGDMARSLEVFRKGYLKLDRVRQEQAEQQLEKEEMRKAQAATLLQLADQFERTVGDVVGGVAAASTQLQLTASSMASAAEQSALQTTEVSAALSEASGGVTAAAAASDEFAMSIGEISRQAATSADLARKATISAADADATISALATSAQQVGQIVELISTIAQRTNLLALNASIEAARGGEAGRGFAVVASEVKELAAQTSKATDAVAAQIRAIQESTGASVSALKVIGSQVEQLEATSVSIAAAVDQQSVAGQDLARSIDLAARSTDDVSSNIVQVRETSLATGAAASQVLTSSTELEQQAVVLKAQVQEFLSHVRAA
ncbi:MAG: methyl-accepting chemotaxis protein [Novosphingobium sp.]